jgi:aryl-alcohol dehydrogenase-like predicted oxidoreductase
MAIPTSTLGRTGEKVTKLGFGAMELRSRRLDPIAVDRLLNTVLDEGINLIDTSPDYGASEEHIGRAISHRRDEYFLATKCGCPVGEPSARGGQPAASTSSRGKISGPRWNRAFSACGRIAWTWCSST